MKPTSGRRLWEGLFVPPRRFTHGLFAGGVVRQGIALALATCLLLLTGTLAAGCGSGEQQSAGTSESTSPASEPFALKLAVEFNDHAASAMIAEEKGWFAETGLDITAVENYVTGADLAAALTRGDIQAAYICLVPAINARANGGVDIKIVCGTHKYGYGLVVNPAKVSAVEDLAKEGVKIGCAQPGTPTDLLLQHLCEQHDLPREEISKRVQRMNPPAQVLALQAGKIDACFVPEHWATMAEAAGFKVLVTAQEIWPDMQGSVLAVKSDLLESHPDVVEKLVDITGKANGWINENPDEAAAILAQRLTVTGQTVLPEKAVESAAKLQVTPEIVAKSMSRLEYGSDIESAQVEATISYMDTLGFLKKTIETSELLDLRFLP